jgi:hypothetical protein
MQEFNANLEFSSTFSLSVAIWFKARRFGHWNFNSDSLNYSSIKVLSVFLVEYRDSIFKEATNISFGINTFVGHITVLSIEIYRVSINYQRILESIFSQILNRNTWCYYHLKEEYLKSRVMTTTSKLPSERSLNRHKTVTSRKFQDTQ